MGNEIKGIDTAAIATAIQTLGHAKALLSSAQAQYGNGEPCPMRIDVGNSYVDGLCDKSTIAGPGQGCGGGKAPARRDAGPTERTGTGTGSVGQPSCNRAGCQHAAPPMMKAKAKGGSDNMDPRYTRLRAQMLDAHRRALERKAARIMKVLDRRGVWLGDGHDDDDLMQPRPRVGVERRRAV